ncbi:hypothetical protein [Sphingomonas sp. CFBP 13706]|uniref:hypothetical protein n=1 Tax=Sphingomonas sp. CFBP 13706 TaxID=2775314 RepID=UPI001780E05B|nr:hypothetical protein [Sphingomonas sp. CFBP 13706]MBD8735365.1 hypothetical protein [Sphingomonas sp. CFBP 13706]
MLLHQSNDVIDPAEAALLQLGFSAMDVEAPALRWGCDPLDPDATADVFEPTSPRRLLRLAIAAADVGARFAREGLDHDPVAWMLTPRAVFEGLTPMDACQDLKHFKRSIVLHALGLGLDADPDAIDELLADGGNEHDIDESDVGDVDPGIETSSGSSVADGLLARPRLLTAWLDVEKGGGRLFAFCAVVTSNPADLVERLIARYGSDAENAQFDVGFDHTTPLATAMISDAMADTLALAAADPESPLAAGLDVVVEQRFADWN